MTLTDTLDAWTLDPDKLVCITTDNGSNLVCATTRRLGWKQLPCFGHNLHLAIQNSMKDEARVSRAIAICHKAVGAFSHSWNRKRDFQKLKNTFNCLSTHLYLTVLLAGVHTKNDWAIPGAREGSPAHPE